jgi:hypothetical protein
MVADYTEHHQHRPHRRSLRQQLAWLHHNRL